MATLAAGWSFVACTEQRNARGALELLPLAQEAAWGMSAVAGVAWVDDTTLIMADPDLRQLLIYNPDTGRSGRLLREGTGPAELTLPADVLGSPRGYIVADAGQQRVTEVDRNGAYLGSVNTPGLPLRLLGVRDGVVHVAVVPASGGPLIVTLDLAAGVVRKSIRPWQIDSSLAQPSQISTGGVPFISVAMAPGGSYMVGVGHVYSISTISADGVLLGRFGRNDVQAEMPREDEIEAIRASARRTAGAMANAKVVMDAIDRVAATPKPFFGASSFTIDSAGRLWIVTTRRTDDSTAIDVFSRAGEYLGSINLRDKVERLALRLPRLAAIVERTGGPFEGHKSLDLYAVPASLFTQ